MDPLQYTRMFELEESHWWFLVKQEFIKVFLPKTRHDLNILDVGSGTGGTSLFLKKWGRVTGLEPSPHAFPYLDKRKIYYLKSSFANCRLKKNYFDLVCFFDVLYHQGIANDQPILEKAYTLLKPHGLLCITDSACKFLFSKHDKIMHARQRYSLKEMENKVRSAGFSIKRKSYIFFFTFPLFLISRLLNKYIDFPTVHRIPKIFNSPLLALCKLEARLLRYFSFPVGSSVIILAQK